METSTVLKWGIASAGKICHDFVTALGSLPQTEHLVTAVGARDINRAQEFAKLHEIANSYGSYLELARDSNVDVVYVGVLNPQHYEVALIMLENGKHVICEKPLCLNGTQAKKLIEFAESKKLFLMEAIWSRFFPAYQYLRKQIDSGVLGEIKKIEMSFGSNSQRERMLKRSLGGGTILDLGVYAIQFSQWVFREPPAVIKATGELNEDGVDIHVDTTLTYTNGGVTKIKTSAKTKLANEAIIHGSKGQITIQTFWCPLSLIDIDGTEKTWTLPEGKHKTNFLNSIGLRYEAEEVRKCILSGKFQSEEVTHSDSLIIANIEDEIRRQIGVVYDQDN